MSFLDANLRALAAAPGLRTLPDVDPGPFSVDGPAHTPQVYLTTTRGARVALHSVRDPAADARRQLERALSDHAAVHTVVLVGLGAGYLIDAVEAARPDACIVALDPSPACVRATMARRDLSGLLSTGRLLLLVGPEYRGSSDGWRYFAQDGDAARVTIVNPVLVRECPDEVAAAIRVVETMAFGARANAAARRQFAGRYLLNSLRNLGVIAGSGSAGDLFDAFPGVPAVIVSAGPSLDDHLDALREVRERVLIVAVDTAARPLLQSGIVPHLVVGVDPGEANARHFAGLPDTRSSYLVAEGSLAPTAFAAFENRVFTFKVSDHEPWPWFAELGIVRPTLRAWGSVAATALDLVLRGGCDPVVLVGQDLAFTGGRPYCRNTTYETDWAEAEGRGTSLEDTWAAWRAGRGGVVAPDVRGGTTETSASMLAVRDWMLELVARHPERRFVNAGGAGILVGPGIEQARLLDALSGATRASDVPDTLARAHATTRIDARRVLDAGLAFTRAIPDGASPVVASWLAFATGDLASTDLQCALFDGIQRSNARQSSVATTHAPSPGWLVETLRRRGHRPITDTPADARHLMRTWPSVARMPERVAALRRVGTVAPDTTSGAHVATGTGWGATALGTATRAVERVLTARVAATATAPGVGEHLVQPGRGWLPQTALFAWHPDVARDVDLLEDALRDAAERARASAATPPPSFFETAITRGDADNADEEQPLLAAPSIDALARAAVMRTWLDVLDLLAPSLRVPTKGPQLPAAHLEPRPAGPASDGYTGHGIDLVGVPCVGLDPTPASSLALPLTLPTWRAMRVVTGRIADPRSTHHSVPANDLWLRTACSGSDEPSDRLDIRTAARTTLDADRDPRHVFFSQAVVSTLRPIVLTDAGVPRTQRCVPLNADEVLVTPVHGRSSLRIDAECGQTPEPDRDVMLVGELPFGGEGMRVVWGHQPAPYIGLRDANGDLRDLEPTPFVPFRPAATADARLLWATDDGLWEWTPRAARRRLAAVPPCYGIRLDGLDCRLDPRIVSASGHPVRSRKGCGWIWRHASQVVDEVALDALGPCWSVTSNRGWTAETFPHADLVRVVSPDQRAYHVACFYPVQAAWAGPTLVVTTRHGDVLAFKALVQHLTASA